MTKFIHKLIAGLLVLAMEFTLCAGSEFPGLIVTSQKTCLSPKVYLGDDLKAIYLGAYQQFQSGQTNMDLAAEDNAPELLPTPENDRREFLKSLVAGAGELIGLKTLAQKKITAAERLSEKYVEKSKKFRSVFKEMREAIITQVAPRLQGLTREKDPDKNRSMNEELTQAIKTKYRLAEIEGEKVYVVGVKGFSGKMGFNAYADASFTPSLFKENIIIVLADDEFAADKEVIRQAILERNDWKKEESFKTLKWLGKFSGFLVGIVLAVRAVIYFRERLTKATLPNAIRAIKQGAGVKVDNNGDVLVQAGNIEIRVNEDSFAIYNLKGEERVGFEQLSAYPEKEEQLRKIFYAVCNAVLDNARWDNLFYKIMILLSPEAQKNWPLLFLLAAAAAKREDAVSLEDLLIDVLRDNQENYRAHAAAKELVNASTGARTKLMAMLSLQQYAGILTAYQGKEPELARLMAELAQSGIHIEGHLHNLLFRFNSKDNPRGFIIFCAEVGKTPQFEKAVRHLLIAESFLGHERNGLDLSAEYFPWLGSILEQQFYGQNINPVYRKPEELLDLVKRYPLLRVALTPMLLFYHLRCRIITGTPIVEFLAQLSETEMAELEKRGIPGLMESIRWSRENEFIKTDLAPTMFIGLLASGDCDKQLFALSYFMNDGKQYAGRGFPLMAEVMNSPKTDDKVSRQISDFCYGFIKNGAVQYVFEGVNPDLSPYAAQISQGLSALGNPEFLAMPLLKGALNRSLIANQGDLLKTIAAEPGLRSEAIAHLKQNPEYFLDNAQVILESFNPALSSGDCIDNIRAGFALLQGPKVVLSNVMMKGQAPQVFISLTQLNFLIQPLLTGEFNAGLTEPEGSLLKAAGGHGPARSALIEFFSSDRSGGSKIFLEHTAEILAAFNPELSNQADTVRKLYANLSSPSVLTGLLLDAGKLQFLFNSMIINSQGNIYRFVKQMLENGNLPADVKKQMLDITPAAIIAKALRINIKLARYLKERSGVVTTSYGGNVSYLQKLSNPDFKEKINEIAYLLNRETTVHPAERRLGEDQKNSLFDYLFNLEDLTRQKAVFDEYHRNAPERYRIEISALRGLLQYINIEQIKTLIRTVIDDPKQSLDELTASLKQQVQGRPNADYLVRRMEWLLSNLFVLQDKIEQLEPLVRSFQERGLNAEDLSQVLGEIDTAKKFSQLVEAAANNNLGLVEVFNLKVESVSQEATEDLLAEGLRQVDFLLLEPTEKEELFNELIACLNSQPAQSRLRIYLKLLFSLSTDNEVVLRVLEEIRGSRPISGLKNSYYSCAFLTAQRSLISGNNLFFEYLEQADKAADKSLRKEALKQLRSLCQNRQYSGKKLTREFIISLEGLQGQIAFPRKPAVQLPHAYYEPLLRLNPSQAALEHLRALIASLHSRKALHDQLATLKNNLLEKVIALAGLDYEQKGGIVSGLLEILNQRHSQDAEKFYSELMLYLEDYALVIDVYFKAQKRALPEHLNDKLEALAGEILAALISRKEISRPKIEELKTEIAALEAEFLLARFKAKAAISDEEVLRERLKEYCAANPRFNWRDHQGRNIYKLIDVYLATIDESEIYDNLLAGLEREMQGDFSSFKYESSDYQQTLGEIIEIETEKLPEQGKIELREALSRAQGDTPYEKLQAVEGFEKIKEKIAKIKNGWEQLLNEPLEDGETAEFSDDFYVLFNIGNYPGSTACQSCTYGNNLNRGLPGYVLNGTNKAAVILNNNRQVITRRIVRLRIVTDEQGNRQPVIFVEESTQFGVNKIDGIYDLLEKVAQDTDLPVVATTYRPAQTPKVLAGALKDYSIELYRGRSTFDYSDLYGGSVPGKITAGLYQQAEAKVTTPVFKLLVKSRTVSGIVEERFDLRMRVFDKESKFETIFGAEAQPGAHMVRIDDPVKSQVEALTEAGYFYKPGKLVYELEIPQLKTGGTLEQAMEEYYGGFASKRRNQFKKDVRKIDENISTGALELVFDEGENGQNNIEEFLALYEKEMDAKARGRKPLLDEIKKNGGTARDYLKNKRMGVYLKKDGRIIGGIIVRKFRDRYSISFAATDSAARQEIRSMQFFLMQSMIKESIKKGFARLGYGVDTNLYGHHLSTGLMQAKINSGFVPKSTGTSELMKITDFNVFDLPVFFFNFGANNQLESTLIITEELLSQVKQFKGITPTLNIYIMNDGKLVKFIEEKEISSPAFRVIDYGQLIEQAI
ncbi:MAG: GNAT family N-acetyltransferase [Candidatus Omnitrophica bacterium]|nr:GNAT family N-acetyltransferase [Candidatus Omnitrophota bacterium]